MGDIPNSTSMSTTSHQQSWSLNGDAEEIQLYETQYPISEWDQNLDLLLDELQESVSSPQQAKGRNQITSLPTIPASERQSPNKSVSSSTKVLSSSQFLALAEEALRQTTIARRLLESIADEPTAANLPSSPTSANARLSSNTIAGSQPPETLLTDNINSLAATESENSNPPTSVSERAKAWTTRVQTVQPSTPPTTPQIKVSDGKSTESFPTAEGLRSFKLHPATIEAIETALTNLKIATDSKKILTYTEHMEYTQVPSNSDITGSVMSEDKPAESIAAESPPKCSSDNLKILEFTELLSSQKINASNGLPPTGTDGSLLESPSNSTDGQKVFDDKVKSRTSPSDIDEWATKLAQLDSALNLLIEGLDNHID
ncbi:hypothetical protein DAPPUDRAFT_335101 [Daphnia pulex]|uniref:Uncharacterized protein n=1 Tax=Daphnia pulex TaxID=6669 RepID=E9HX23_DAPPU|nr:hypothetical protein DAPPUDRAFT_335101 [Daphnia pulex]|eukprot:EFX63707.1 hypothetical protein DAPPUDRAFT_335101 [Daphnia pulex]